MMTAAKFKLDNLTCVVDRNFIQIDGSTEDVMPLEPLADKYRAFNWEVFVCEGNDIGAFIATLEGAKQVRGKPQVIIANTVPGKGVSFMEHDYLWHGKPPKADEADVALRELLAAREAIVASHRGSRERCRSRRCGDAARRLPRPRGNRADPDPQRLRRRARRGRTPRAGGGRDLRRPRGGGG